MFVFDQEQILIFTLWCASTSAIYGFPELLKVLFGFLSHDNIKITVFSDSLVSYTKLYFPLFMNKYNTVS